MNSSVWGSRDISDRWRRYELGPPLPDTLSADVECLARPETPHGVPTGDEENLEPLCAACGREGVRAVLMSAPMGSTLSKLTLCAISGRLGMLPSARLPQAKRRRKQSIQLTTPLIHLLPRPTSAERKSETRCVSWFWSSQLHVASTLSLYMPTNTFWTAPSNIKASLTHSFQHDRHTLCFWQVQYA
jgi:hypothetical protein